MTHLVSRHQIPTQRTSNCLHFLLAIFGIGAKAVAPSFCYAMLRQVRGTGRYPAPTLPRSEALNQATRLAIGDSSVELDLDQLTSLEIIARKQRRSVEEIILEAVLRYAHRKSRPLSTEDDEDDRDDQADWWKN